MPKLVKKAAPAEAEFLANARRIADIAADFKAQDIRGYDIRGLSTLTDCFVVCSAQSEPQLKSMYNGIRDGMKEIGVSPLHMEGTSKGNWMVLDYCDIVVHIFRTAAREFYDLDGLWGDAPQLELDVEP